MNIVVSGAGVSGAIIRQQFSGLLNHLTLINQIQDGAYLLVI